MADYYDLGTYSRAVTTQTAEAQLWFDRGILWTFGFNHDEAVQCFRKALDHDPDCAMAWWGVAHAIGANYNKPWEAFDPEDLSASLTTARNAVDEALARRDGLTPVEDALISALPALGALLLEQGEVGEAAGVYRADLGLDDTIPQRLPASGQCLEPARIS